MYDVVWDFGANQYLDLEKNFLIDGKAQDYAINFMSISLKKKNVPILFLLIVPLRELTDKVLRLLTEIV